ncbi:MAG: hypothetical protein Kow00108_23690 [Calditrichia bacterium]
MKGIYARSNQVADVMQNIKLSLAAWKVLFIIDGKTDLEKFEHVLGLSESDLLDAINELKDLDLIEVVESGEGAVEEEELLADFEKVEKSKEPAVEEENVLQEMDETLEEIEEDLSESFADDIEDFLSESEEEIGADLSDTEAGEELLSEDVFEQLEKEPAASEEIPESQNITEPEMEEINEDELLADLEKDLQDFMLEEEKTPEEVSKEVLEKEIASSVQEDDLEISELLGEEFEDIGVEDEAPAVETPKQQVVEEAPTATEQPSEPIETKTASAEKKLLVVDDSVVIRKMVEIALENETIEVTAAATGKEALSRLDEESIDLVILDLMLPDLNGLDILKAIKAASTDLPVIILTGKDSSKDLEMAKEYGADDFITKPFKDDDLVNKVKSLI